MSRFVHHQEAYTDLDDCVGRTLLYAAVDVGLPALDPQTLGGAALQRCGNHIVPNPALQAAEKSRFVSGYAFRHTVSAEKSSGFSR
jgi:hypothetical protein